jgi:hypothetical protein
MPWRAALGVVDGQPVAMVLRRDRDRWVPDSIARIDGSNGRVVSVADYKHCPWVLASATSVTFSAA